MYRINDSRFAGLAIVALALSPVGILLGCGTDHKVQQIQNGVQDVERHAQEIEDAAQATQN